MIKSFEEILASAKSIIGDNTDDNVLEFVGDLSDTLNSYKDSETKIKTLEQEKADLDSSWRQKYRDRFFTAAPPKDEIPPDPREAGLKTKFEELFKS